MCEMFAAFPSHFLKFSFNYDRRFFEISPRTREESPSEIEESLFASPRAQSRRSTFTFSYVPRKFITSVITPNSSLARAVDNASGN